MTQRGRALLPALAAALVGCSSVALLPRYPFVEDPDLELRHETLTLAVDADGSVRVAALFHFVPHAPARDRLLTFPIGPPRQGALGFSAQLLDAEPGAVSVARGEAGALPMGDVVESWDIWLGARGQGPSTTRLLVQYVQPGSGDFGYVLKSGAYWRGPIGKLVLVVSDPHARVAAIQIEGHRIEAADRRRVVLELVDLEPNHEVKLELK
ncbi:MAG: hypothetical protein HYZ29_21995 [Myxococcales bacterium]|nr:hypothetical protein [Myxococcales bacterium]